MENMVINLDFAVDSNRFEMAIAAGLNTVYCANTGIEIAKLDSEELKRCIELESSLFPTSDDETFLDRLTLSMLPINSRPSPLFQGMDSDKYHQLSIQFPEHMFRYLAGRILFDRWTHKSGLTSLPGKAAWLQSIHLDGEKSFAFMECLRTMIRLDAIFSSRRYIVTEKMQPLLESNRADWLGFDEFSYLVEVIESENILALERKDVHNDGVQKGNPFAVPSMVKSAIESIDSEEYMRHYEQRKAYEIMRTASNEKRSQEEMRKLKRKFAGTLGGETTVRHGIDAIWQLANLGDALSKEAALKLLATHDNVAAASKMRQKIEKTGGAPKTKGVGGVKKAEAQRTKLESKLGFKFIMPTIGDMK